MNSEFEKNMPLSDDNVEENMEDILNSIRQIMNMDMDQASTKPAKSSSSPSKEISDILNIAPRKSQPSVVLKPKTSQDDVLVLKRPTAPAKEKPVPQPQSKEKNIVPQSNAPLSLPSMVENAIKPVIEEWLTNNLERILEDIVREEIKKMLNITRQDRTL